jgi:hypothetical protein
VFPLIRLCLLGPSLLGTISVILLSQESPTTLTRIQKNNYIYLDRIIISAIFLSKYKLHNCKTSGWIRVSGLDKGRWKLSHLINSSLWLRRITLLIIGWVLPFNISFRRGSKVIGQVCYIIVYTFILLLQLVLSYHNI